MALDSAGMDLLRDRRATLCEEPVYCAAYDGHEEVLLQGSDEALSRSERIAKRLRYEDHALRYLRGQRPKLLSTILRGPFDRASGWRNPWLKGNQHSDYANAAQTEESPRVAVKGNAPTRIDQEIDDVGTDRTPATRDSVQYHLPSPDSHRELELTDNNQLETASQLRIREWAHNIPTATLERDEFWAPGDGPGDVSDGSATPKRPAGKGWLKSKLHKRRKMDNISSFATEPTPTPKPIGIHKDATTASSQNVFVRTGTGPQIPPIASRSFEQNTPASSCEQNNRFSPPRPASGRVPNGTISTAKDKPPRYNVAVKASAFRRSASSKSGKSARSSSGTSGTGQQKHLLFDDLLAPKSKSVKEQTSSDHHVLSPSDKIIPLAHGPDALQTVTQQQISSDAVGISFESHLDQSFQYKARAAKQEAAKLRETGAIARSSQATQTGTPGSGNPDDPIGVQHPEISVDDSGRACAMETIHMRAQQDADAVLHERPRITPEKEDAGRGSDAQGDLSNAKKSMILEETTFLPADDITANNGVRSNVPQKSTSVVCEPESDIDIAKILSTDAKSYASLPETILDESSTFISDPKDVDASTPCQTTMPPQAGTDTVKHFISQPPPRPPPRLETVKSFRQFSPHLDSEETTYVDESESREGARLIRELPGQPEKAQEVSIGTLSKEPPVTVQQSQGTTGRAATVESVRDTSSENDRLVTKITLSQTECVTTDPEDILIQTAEKSTEDLRPRLKLYHSADKEEMGQTSMDITLQQSPWAPDDPQIKTEPVEEEDWFSCSHPISVASSPASAGPQLELDSSQPKTGTVNQSDAVAALNVSMLLQRYTGLEQSFRVAEEEQSPWTGTNNYISPSPQATTLSHDDQPQPVSISPLPITMESRTADEIAGIASASAMPASCQQPNLRVSSLPATPSQTSGYRQSPEPTFSIKSFATFNTPSPKRRRISKQPRSSLDRLPSAQIFADAANINPWSSVRSSLRSSARPRSHLRVSFGPLPGNENDIGNDFGEPQFPHTAIASPPPQANVSGGDENFSGRFHKHFDAIKLRDRTGMATPTFRLVPRLLPSESQQVPISPEVGMMAQAFREADIAEDRRNSPIRGVVLSEHDGFHENGAITQSPWRVQSQNLGMDDVADVLQNLDDFLNPRWDVDTELDKAKTANGIENQRQVLNPGEVIFGTSFEE